MSVARAEVRNRSRRTKSGSQLRVRGLPFPAILLYSAIAAASLSGEGTRLGDGLFVATLTGLAAYYFFKTGGTLPRRLLKWTFALSYGWLTAVWSLNSQLTLVKATYVILPVLAVYYVAYEVARRYGLGKLLIASGTIGSMYAIASLIVDTVASRFGPALVGLAGNSNQLGNFLAVMLTPAAYLAATNPKAIGWPRLASFALGLLIMGMTRSRGAVGVAVVTFAMAMLVDWRRVKRSQVARLLGTGFMVLISVAGVYGILARNVSDLGSRPQLWRIGLSEATAIGHGVGSSAELLAVNGFPWFNSWHNGYIGAVVEGGIPWLFVALALIAEGFVMGVALRRWPSREQLGAITLGLTVAWAGLQIAESQILRNLPIFHAYVALLAGASAELQRALTTTRTQWSAARMQR